MALRDDILANPACTEPLAARDCNAIAAIISIGRTRPSSREIGTGTIFQTLGIAAANTLLDAITADTTFRHILPLIKNGWLTIGSPLVQSALQAMVPATITQVQADALLALGTEPDPVSAQDVGDAMFNPNGTLK